MLRMSWVVVLLGGMGCAGPEGPSDDDVADIDTSGEVDVDPDRTDGLPSVDQIVIAMQPRLEGQLSAIPHLDEGPDGPRLRFEASLTLADGEDYPRSFRATFPQPWWGSCGFGNTTVELPTLVDTTDVVDLEVDPTGVIDIELRQPGRASFTGVGSVTFLEEGCEQPVGTTLPLDFSLSVTVRPALDARISTPCSGGPLWVAPGALPTESLWGQWFSVELVDEDGSFHVDNAAADAQVTVVLDGTFDVAHANPASLSAWIPPSVAGPVTVRPRFGPETVVEVVPPEAVTDIEVEFQIGGAASGPSLLQDGGAYGPGWARTGNRIAPMVQRVWIGDDPLCSAPSLAWFELTTSTPEVCEPADLTFLFYGDGLGRAMRLREDGTCALQLETPLGPIPFAASFENVDSLIEW